MSRSYRKPYRKVELADKKLEKRVGSKKARKTDEIPSGSYYKKLVTLSWNYLNDWWWNVAPDHLERK